MWYFVFMCRTATRRWENMENGNTILRVSTLCFRPFFFSAPIRNDRIPWGPPHEKCASNWVRDFSRCNYADELSFNLQYNPDAIFLHRVEKKTAPGLHCIVTTNTLHASRVVLRQNTNTKSNWARIWKSALCVLQSKAHFLSSLSFSLQRENKKENDNNNSVHGVWHGGATVTSSRRGIVDSNKW